MAFRITPSLGPDVEQLGPVTGFYWDLNNVTPAGVQGVSSQLGSKCIASDAREYILCKAGATLAASAVVIIDPVTFIATAGGAAYRVPPALTGGVVLNQFFWAQSSALT